MLRQRDCRKLGRNCVLILCRKQRSELITGTWKPYAINEALSKQGGTREEQRDEQKEEQRVGQKGGWKEGQKEELRDEQKDEQKDGRRD